MDRVPVIVRNKIWIDRPTNSIIEWAKNYLTLNNPDYYKKLKMNKFVGEIDQIPPKYSAKCIDGKRGYQLARKGVDFELAPKKVTILSAEVLGQVGEKEFEFKFDDLSVVTVLGRNKLNVYHKDKVYQFKPHPRFNSLKFVHFYYRYKNIKEGNNDGYLGI